MITQLPRKQSFLTVLWWTYNSVCCSRALKLDSKNHVLFSNRSAAYTGLEQYRKALADANSCIQISPAFTKGYSRQAYAYLKLNKPGFAEKAYRQGLQLDPTYAALKQGLASLLKVLYMLHIPTDCACCYRLQTWTT